MAAPLTRREIEEMHDKLRDAYAKAARAVANEVDGTDVQRFLVAAGRRTALATTTQALLAVDERLRELDSDSGNIGKLPQPANKP